MRKLTPEERKQLQAKLDEQSVEQAEKEQKYWKHRKRMQTVNQMKKGSGAVSALAGLAGAAAQHDMSTSSLESKGKELEGQKRKKRTGRGPGLKQMKLTAEEKRQLEAKIRGNK